ncbi:MAG: KH domain-containing protein [Thermodesulfobacteriota bacterium]|nr:KH domain-containing protein [Thermodesulfobacteriota bacterium]
MLQELIVKMVQALVDDPKSVKVSVLEGERTSVVELKVAKNDLGKIIGRGGATAAALRTILTAASTKLRKRAILAIVEGCGSFRTTSRVDPLT